MKIVFTTLIFTDMKKFILAFALLIGVSSFYNTVEAQKINISINIGRQPAWGPVGYDYVGYYYFPDIDCYYDVNLGMFHYMNRGRWVSARYLPYAYRHYDLYGLYKVVLNVNDPWRYHHIHHRDYARYRGHRNQIVIRDSRDNRYHNSKNNRVVWYSNNNKKSTPKKEYRYDNKDNRNKKYNNNRYESNNNTPKNKDNKYANRSNERKNVKQSESRSSNNRSDKNQSRNYNSSNQSRKNSSSDKNIRQSTTSRSSNYRLASNNGRSR